MNHAGIYVIQNRSNGKIYIGSAVHLRKRRYRHFSMLRTNRHKNSHLQNAWNKYGPDAFVFRPLLVCAPNSLVFFEQRAIDVFRHSGYELYNTCLRAGSKVGVKMSEAHKRALSDRMKGNHRTRGVKLTDEHKNNISKGLNRYHALKPRRPKALRPKRQKRLPFPMDDERRKQISANLKGHIVTPETRRKLSEALKGKPINRIITDETRRRLSEGVKRSWVKRHG